MILREEQLKIILHISDTFNKKTPNLFIKNSDYIKYSKFYNFDKYKEISTADFKFMVIWTALCSENRYKIMEKLRDYSKEDIDKIKKEKEKIILFKNTLKKDEYNIKITDTDIFSLYEKGYVSIIQMGNYFKDNQPQGRIQLKTKQKIDIFMSYFKIKGYNA